METVEKIKNLIKSEHDKEQKREYLGCSFLGHECGRYLWYYLHDVENIDNDIDSILRFQDGFEQERIMADRLRLDKNITLITKKDDKQITIECDNKHISGHIDGLIKGVEPIRNEWMIWEHKAVNEKKFNKLISLKNRSFNGSFLFPTVFPSWDYVYFVQAITYLYRFNKQHKNANIKYHYLTVSTPGGRDFVELITEFTPDLYKIAEEFLSRAEKIIAAHDVNIYPKLRKADNIYPCNMCNFKNVCHNYKIPKSTCKTCGHSEPMPDGTWHCHLIKGQIATDLLNKGCGNHLYNISLLYNEINPIIAKTLNTIQSNKFTNCVQGLSGKHWFTSSDIYKIGDLREVNSIASEVLKSTFGDIVNDDKLTFEKQIDSSFFTKINGE